MKTRAVAFAALMLASAPSYAQTILKYIDNDGVTHYVQSEEQIPPEYRAGATRPKLPPATPTDPGMSDRMRDALRYQQERENAQRERENAVARFNEVAEACAFVSGVQIIPKPGARVTIFGTAKDRFAFEQCMASRGQYMDARP